LFPVVDLVGVDIDNLFITQTLNWIVLIENEMPSCDGESLQILFVVFELTPYLYPQLTGIRNSSRRPGLHVNPPLMFSSCFAISEASGAVLEPVKTSLPCKALGDWFCCFWGHRIAEKTGG